MKKLLCLVVLMFGLVFMCASSGYAILLSFTPETSIVEVGDIFDVDVFVTGLEESNSTEIVSAFDLRVIYDPLIVLAESVTFGYQLGDPWLAASDLSVTGKVDFWETSLLEDDILNVMQDDSVFLATLSFQTIGIGSTALNFVPNPIMTGVDTIDIKGKGGQILDVVAENGYVAPVPEPATIILLSSGLIAFAGWRRRSNSSNF